MENWGLITYGEQVLVVDPETSSTGARENIASFITHELAHQVCGTVCRWGFERVCGTVCRWVLERVCGTIRRWVLERVRSWVLRGQA